MTKVLLLIISLIICAFSLSTSMVIAQDQLHSESAPESAAVVDNGKRLFVYYAKLKESTPAQRAAQTDAVIRKLESDPNFDAQSIKLVETSEGTDVVAGSSVVATMSIDDARIAHSSTRELANEAAAKLKGTLAKPDEHSSPRDIAVDVGLCIGATIVLLLSIGFTTNVMVTICRQINFWQGTKIQSIKIQQAELLSAESLAQVLLISTKLACGLIILFLFSTYLLLVLSSFPSTRPWAASLIDNSITPLTLMGESLLGYLPKGLVVVIIGFVTYAVMAFSNFIFNAVEAETIKFTDFDPEWAVPTSKLLRLLIIAFALVAALPYLPGWESESFRQVGLFTGLLLSLGSTSVVGNMLAGTVLTYSKAFKIGDRIKVGDCVGDIVERTLFVTRVCTPKNEIVSLPNGTILNTNIVNYSKMAKTGNLILYTTVTIAYNVDWRKVHKLLLEAASASENIVQEPAPFVLQTALNDHHVSYQLNAFTNNAHDIPVIYSLLHQNIQDKFNEAAIEIMSPGYSSLRDGNHTTTPEQYLPEGYAPSSFRLAK